MNIEKKKEWILSGVFLMPSLFTNRFPKLTNFYNKISVIFYTFNVIWDSGSNLYLHQYSKVTIVNATFARFLSVTMASRELENFSCELEQL